MEVDKLPATITQRPETSGATDVTGTKTIEISAATMTRFLTTSLHALIAAALVLELRQLQ